MAVTDMQENLLNDLLTRIQKIESTKAADTQLQEYVATLDRVAFSMTIAIDVISSVLIEKGIVTKEELDTQLNTRRDAITKEIQARMPETVKE